MVIQPPTSVDTVLVPVDGSRFSVIALPVALALADRLGAEIQLFSAVDTVEEVAEREGELAEIRPSGRQVSHSVLVDRDPAGAIHEALRRRSRAVVCMASHGRGRSAALVGSVASDVVVRGHDPLIVVGPSISDELKGAGVLACVDETAASAALIPIALRWSSLLGEPLIVTTVAEPVPPPLRDGPVHRRFGPRGAVGAFLESLVAPVRGAGPEVEALAIYDPISPAEGVRSYLEEQPVALVIVSSHARTGMARIAFGSVAASIVHHSPSPVLVVPRPDARPDAR
jgi:nucleotide-binding universal stress UspA family protein